MKCVQREEFAIVGWTAPQGQRKGVGALLLGYYDAGKKLHYAGKVGTGFTERDLVDLRKRLEPLRCEIPPLDAKAEDAPRNAFWAKPELVAELRFSEWTPDHRLRHPSFLGLREDKQAKDVVIDPAAGTAVRSSRGPATAEPEVSASGSAEIGGVRITNAERVLWPEQGLSKLDLAQYYLTIADWMLPHVAGRPLTLFRCPEGRRKQCFFQKHERDGTPAELRRIEVPEKDGTSIYLAVEDAKGLVSLVQLGVLEIHVWGSTRRNLERADRVILDLDPDEGMAWSRVQEAALSYREMLKGMGLESFVKTTGGKGLHIVVPLLPKYGWDEIKAFAKYMAEEMVRREPNGFTSSIAKKARGGKIFVDYLRNQRGATAIAAYSSRAKDGAPVSVPISWREVEVGIRSDQFTVTSLPGRLAALKADPWAGISGVKQSLSAAVRRKLRA